MNFPALDIDPTTVSVKSLAAVASVGIGLLGWILYSWESAHGQLAVLEAAREKYCAEHYPIHGCSDVFEFNFESWKPRGKVWRDLEPPAPPSTEESPESNRSRRGVVFSLESSPSYTDQSGAESFAGGIPCRGDRVAIPPPHEHIYLVYEKFAFGVAKSWRIVASRERRERDSPQCRSDDSPE